MSVSTIMSNFIKRMVQRNLGSLPKARPLFVSRYAREEGGDASIEEGGAPIVGNGAQRLARSPEAEPEETEEAAPSVQRKIQADASTLRRASGEPATASEENERKESPVGDLMPRSDGNADLPVQRRAAPSAAPAALSGLAANAPTAPGTPSAPGTPAANESGVLPASPAGPTQRRDFSDLGPQSSMRAGAVPLETRDSSASIVDSFAGDLMPPVNTRGDEMSGVEPRYEAPRSTEVGEVENFHKQTFFDDSPVGVSGRTPSGINDAPLLPPVRPGKSAFFEAPPLLHRPNAAPPAVRGLDQSPSNEPAVRIHIGRIEVRSVSETAHSAPAPAAEQSSHRPMSLEEYLKRVNGEAL